MSTYLSGEDGVFELWPGGLLKVTRFDAEQQDKEADATGIGEAQESGDLLTWRIRGHATGLIERGMGSGLARQYPNVLGVLVIDPTSGSPNGSIEGTWNVMNVHVVVERERETVITFEFRSQNVAAGPAS